MVLHVKPVTIRRLAISKTLPRAPFIRHVRAFCSAVDWLVGGAVS